MESKKTAYKKLPGKKKKFIGDCRLWIGRDHLLLVESTGISENYKRFYFKDIQAINLLKTNTTLFQSIFIFILLLLTGIMAMVIWNSNVDAAVVIVPAIIGLCFLFYLILLFVRGPSCKCYL
ncbi:MAG: hypothetical protein GY729_01465, partial [Desulfobacteraceae bacterium]|nr:hypothetical protein [Desulfobacteraceae bacterium]